MARGSGWRRYPAFYGMTGLQLRRARGPYLVTLYNASTYSILSRVYPSYSWLPWLMEHAPGAFWLDAQNQRAFLDSIAPQLDVTRFFHFHKLSMDSIATSGGKTLRTAVASSVTSTLRAAFPEFAWSPWNFDFAPVLCPRVDMNSI